MYLLPERRRRNRAPLAAIANLGVAPSVVSLERGLSIHEMIPEAVPLVQSVSSGRGVLSILSMAPPTGFAIKQDSLGATPAPERPAILCTLNVQATDHPLWIDGLLVSAYESGCSNAYLVFLAFLVF
jgi:hypothetical protein